MRPHPFGTQKNPIQAHKVKTKSVQQAFFFKGTFECFCIAHVDSLKSTPPLMSYYHFTCINYTLNWLNLGVGTGKNISANNFSQLEKRRRGGRGKNGSYLVNTHAPSSSTGSTCRRKTLILVAKDKMIRSDEGEWGS